MASLTPEAQEIFGAKYDPADELWLRVFFTPSERSQAAGRKYLERQRARKENRDPLPNEKVAPAQVAALQKWGAPAKDPYAKAVLRNNRFTSAAGFHSSIRHETRRAEG
jgi:hypothetical protein